MNSHRIVILVAIVLIALPCASQAQSSEFDTPEPSPVWRNVTIVDAHDWQYADVELRWVNGGEALQLRRPDGATKTFQPDEILWVYAADGRDITAEVAEARLSGSPPEPVREPAPPAPARDLEVGGSPERVGPTLAERTVPRLFQLTVGFGLGYATHAGDWFLGLDDGMNYQADMRVMVGPRNFLHFIYRHQDFGHQTFDFYDYPTIGIDTSLREYQFLIGKHAPLIEKNDVRSVAYVASGISVMDHRFTTSQSHLGDSLTKMGWVLQGGVLVLMSEGVAWDFSASGTWKPGFSDDESGGLLLGAHLGLTALF